MGLKDIFSTEKRKRRSEDLNRALEESRIQKLVVDRQKSANERELERFYKEYREENIKKELEEFRKKRKKEIEFGHNPLNTENITTKPCWQVLKEKNQFNGKGNMFSNQKNIIKNNPRLLNNGKILK